VALEELLEGLGVHLERQVLTDVALDDGGDLRVDVFRLFPVTLEPLLQDLDFTADLDVQLDVAGEAGLGEIARSYRGGRANNSQLGMGDVGLRVELLLRVQAALDLALGQRVEDGRNALQEVVLLLRLLDALV
jgi:hypothetical protein